MLVTRRKDRERLISIVRYSFSRSGSSSGGSSRRAVAMTVVS